MKIININSVIVPVNDLCGTNLIPKVPLKYQQIFPFNVALITKFVFNGSLVQIKTAIPSGTHLSIN